MHVEVDLCTDSMDDFGRATLALPWCPEESIVTKVKIVKPEPFELHENEDGTFENKDKAEYPDDYMYEAVTEYCIEHPRPSNWKGPIPDGYIEQLLEMEISFEDFVTDPIPDVVPTETQPEIIPTETQPDDTPSESQTD